MGRAVDETEILSLNLASTAWTAPIKVLEHAVYRGPHLYSHTPMIRVQIDLGVLERWPSNVLPLFNERLLAMLPGLSRHGCSLRREGGFVERLMEGTWLGHVVEHVALELQSLSGMEVTRGKTRSVSGKGGVYNVMFEYVEEAAGLCAGRLALELVSSLLDPPFNALQGERRLFTYDAPPTFDLAFALSTLKRVGHKTRLGPTTRALVDEAKRRGIPAIRLDEHSFIQLGTGRHQKRIRASITGATSHLGVETAGNKALTKKLLADAGIPVPRGEVVRNAADAVSAAARIKGSVTLKPLDGNHGRGVVTNVHGAEGVSAAHALAARHSRHVVVEKHYHGRDYRILVVGGEIAAVAERVPAHVVGNGVDTVSALIGEVNADPWRGDGHEEVMTKIVMDEHVEGMLKRANVTPESIPPQGQIIWLRNTANLSTGGTAIDRTDEIHPDNALIAQRAAMSVGLDVAGIDMIVPDISRSWRETGGGIVEVNASPGLRMHLRPSEGRARNVAIPVISHLFPRDVRTRVPLAAVTGTNGKSTTVRMVAQVLKQKRCNVGFTSTSGIFINHDCIWQGDASGPKSAKLLLRDPTVDYAILETARGGILREGLAFDSCDVGAVLNISADHLGLQGINTLEDLAAVKSVVTESVRRNGTSVLNADDPYTRAMARHAGGNTCYFSMFDLDRSNLREHVNNGRRAVILESRLGHPEIVVYSRGRRYAVMRVSEIPATLNGLADFNIQNALAATAITFALGAEIKDIRSGLATFTSSYEQNPGRFNIHDDHGFRVIMDYAHNPAALRAFLGVIRRMRCNYRRVIGAISTPGDRRDEDIKEMGRIAAHDFDLLVFREAPDGRGRPKGDVLRLLEAGALEAGANPSRLRSIHAEEEASQFCLQQAEPGDLVILMPTKVDAIWRAMLAFKRLPAPAPDNFPASSQEITVYG